MDDIIKIDTVAQFNAERGQETLHPLVTVLDQSKSKLMGHHRKRSGLYMVYFKELKCGELSYGRGNYDYQEGTMVFIAPGQVFGVVKNDEKIQPTGWALAFHPDFLHGTSLARKIKEYGFFSYDVNEALHLSERERQIVVECFQKIRYELEHAIDKHSKSLVISNIELLLNYCVRYYDRQFITRDNLHRDILSRFETLLNKYFESDKPQTIGLPSVSYCAAQLNLSSNYFGDLIKKETGHSAQEYIQEKIIEVAKERVFDTSKSISEVSYELGFKYPQHFTRLFKQRVGQSPVAYRSLN